MKNKTKKKLYVGIDVHSREHRAAIIPIALLEQTNAAWKSVKTISIKNERDSFNYFEKTIRSQVLDPSEVVISVDHTGGHYSEPIIFFLLSRGYEVYFLESKGIKAARATLLDQECKSDAIDSVSAAYMLYLRDTQGLSFRISLMKYELGSMATVLTSLILQRMQFIKLITQATNRLHQLLIATFPEGEARYFKKLLNIITRYPTPQEIQNSNGLEGIKRINLKDREIIIQLATNSVGVPGDLYAWLIKELGILRMDFISKREVIASMIREHLDRHPYTEILYSFPCFGEIAAATIIGIMKDINNWPNKKKFKKALGVYSTVAQSGMKSRTKRGKEGSRHGRRVLFQVCLGCIREKVPDNDFKDYYLRQVSNGKIRIKALVSTMGKLAEIIYHCLRTGELYEYQGIYR